MSIKRLAVNVKALRKQHKLNQTTLAKRIGVTQAYIAMLEKGDKVNPTLSLLTKLARALKVTVAKLVE
jgi:transcriptional regulator with XRE-family HTH domain